MVSCARMAEPRRSLERTPEARGASVAGLVAHARRGRLRVPRFQRGLKWESSDVCALFDSIYRGLPIGSLLVWKHPAAAARVRLGPLALGADEGGDAWWVVDGQQRIPSLAAALARPWPPPPDVPDPYVVFFDAR